MFSAEIREEFVEKEGLKKGRKAAKIGHRRGRVGPKGHSRKTRIETIFRAGWGWSDFDVPKAIPEKQGLKLPMKVIITDVDMGPKGHSRKTRIETRK